MCASVGRRAGRRVGGIFVLLSLDILAYSVCLASSLSFILFLSFHLRIFPRLCLPLCLSTYAFTSCSVCLFLCLLND
ncbi:hypothetical protein DFP72DRAFT_872029 [Ephemerocybe angulata]|uniref:Uncharacterized protein n=1 Tax=Ephemerocybe angulata TaxID=980116 RepID=A0A8H6IGD3_9AGAR|nr:hypothetical protein DFP72DRAFT_872029 [Tulosesus angulatus]